MPTSKRGKLYHTQTQYEHARYNTSALQYAVAQGYNLKAEGSTFTMDGHDSMVFTSNGQWFWNSMGLKGGAIEFIVSYENKTPVEAVLILNGELEQGKVFVENKKDVQVTPKKEFALPTADTNCRRLFAYLTKERKLDNQIVVELVHQKLIYQAEKYANVVFVGYDEKGVAKNAFQRGTLSNVEKPYKRDVAGSDKNIAWVMKGDDGVIDVSVFESCIDAISHATLEKKQGRYKSRDRISLGGVADRALFNYLGNNPHIRRVTLSLDNDPAGNLATEKIANKLVEKEYEVHIQQSSNKDYNTDLINFLGKAPKERER